MQAPLVSEADGQRELELSLAGAPSMLFSPTWLGAALCQERAQAPRSR